MKIKEELPNGMQLTVQGRWPRKGYLLCLKQTVSRQGQRGIETNSAGLVMKVKEVRAGTMHDFVRDLIRTLQKEDFSNFGSVVSELRKLSTQYEVIGSVD